jgi:hypothetical protein
VGPRDLEQFAEDPVLWIVETTSQPSHCALMQSFPGAIIRGILGLSPPGTPP